MPSLPQPPAKYTCKRCQRKRKRKFWKKELKAWQKERRKARRKWKKEGEHWIMILVPLFCYAALAFNWLNPALDLFLHGMVLWGLIVLCIVNRYTWWYVLPLIMFIIYFTAYLTAYLT